MTGGAWTGIASYSCPLQGNWSVLTGQTAYPELRQAKICANVIPKVELIIDVIDADVDL